MNLNSNPRLENLEISDDPGLCGFLVDTIDEIFSGQAPGDFRGDLPELARGDTDAPSTIPMSTVSVPKPSSKG